MSKSYKTVIGFLRVNGAVIGNAAYEAMNTAMLILRCDSETKTNINQAIGTSYADMSEFNKMKQFMRNRAKDLRAGATVKGMAADAQPRVQQRAPANANFTNTEKVKTCFQCGKQNHLMSQCKTFKTLSISERWNTVIKTKACQNCLNSKRNTCECFKESPRVGACTRCDKSPHTLLQRDPKPSAEMAAIANTAMVANVDEGQAILGTVVLLVRSSSGMWVPLRALLDSGSSESFITTRAVQLLDLLGKSSSLKVQGIGAISGPEVKAMSKITSKVPSDGISAIAERMDFWQIHISKGRGL